MRSLTGLRTLALAALLGCMPLGTLAGNVISTSGFSTCMDNSTIEVKNLDVSYDKNSRVLNFNVAGESKQRQNVTASLIVSAYGRQVYTKEFSPCDEGMMEMCPGRQKTRREAHATSLMKAQYPPQASPHMGSRPFLQNMLARYLASLSRYRTWTGRSRWSSQETTNSSSHVLNPASRTARPSKCPQ